MKYRLYIKGQLITDIKVGEKVVLLTNDSTIIEGVWNTYLYGRLEQYNILINNEPYYFDMSDIKEIRVIEEDIKMNDKENIYLDKEIGIRKDYLYKITIEDVGVITGEILNFNGCTYVIKSYKDKEFNHYIVKYKNILDLHPVMTIEQYNKKQINL